jgi:hypothetical protein
MLALHGLSERLTYDYVAFLREATEIVLLNPLLFTQIRDVNDRDFFEAPAEAFLRDSEVSVLDDITLMRRLRLWRV